MNDSEIEPSREVRQLAAEILVKVDTRKAYADILLDHSLTNGALPARDKGLLTELTYGTLRWRGTIDWHLGRRTRRPLSDTDPFIRNLLRVTLYQLLFLDRIPPYAAVNEGVRLAKAHGGAKAGAFVNAVLRNVLRNPHDRPTADTEANMSATLAAECSHPEWLVHRWLDSFGRDATEALLNSNNEEAPLALRANRLKGTREALIDLLRANGVAATLSRWSPQGIVVGSGTPVHQLAGFSQGLFQVQGESSQLVGHILAPAPGERILDACAGPGGKATHLAELIDDRGEIIATDVSPRGLRKLEENIRRLGLQSIRTMIADIRSGLTGPPSTPYDRVLVDAPCSGLGTLRSHPEIKWQRSERDIARLSRLQNKIIGKAATYVKSGGVLVYATCTLAREENEEVIEEFLAGRKEFALEDVAEYLPSIAKHFARGRYFMALPHRDNTDGFFAARMRKVA